MLTTKYMCCNNDYVTNEIYQGKVPGAHSTNYSDFTSNEIYQGNFVR